VARTGIELATQGFSDLENLFFLLPLIELNQPRPTGLIGKSRFFPGNFTKPKQFKAMLENWQLRWISIFFSAFIKKSMYR